MFRGTKLIPALAGAALGIGLLGTSPAYASPGNTQQTIQESSDAAGAVFTCGSNTIMVTGGTTDFVMHSGLDATGVFHFTGTITVHDITAEDADGNQYTITGASWFGGKGTEDQQQIFTDTEHFVIRGADGGVYGHAQIVEHFTADGSSFVADIGSCEPPADDEG